ncbi:MAG: methylated-DNA--[protein]-cysteine S-methyltransferase [bacterium]|nr:methylated-DNA--[protein]-cysteine S-methyltransferase [bacterium]
MHYSYMASPLGPILIAGDAAGLRLINFQPDSALSQPAPDWVEDRQPLREALDQLDAYFAGTMQDFTLKLAPAGTPFQQSVWHALQDIPYGETTSYGTLAKQLGKPKASRAVGAANGRNPLAIVIPCHRVIGSTGKLTGYAGGLDLKKALLALERRYAPSSEPFNLPFT